MWTPSSVYLLLTMLKSNIVVNIFFLNKKYKCFYRYIRNKFNENYPNNEIPAERLEDIQMYPYILKNWDKDYSKGLPIIKVSYTLDTNFKL